MVTGTAVVFIVVVIVASSAAAAATSWTPRWFVVASTFHERFSAGVKLRLAWATGGAGARSTSPAASRGSTRAAGRAVRAGCPLAFSTNSGCSLGPRGTNKAV